MQVMKGVSFEGVIDLGNRMDAYCEIRGRIYDFSHFIREIIAPVYGWDYNYPPTVRENLQQRVDHVK
jgi:hypothetical protein